MGILFFLKDFIYFGERKEKMVVSILETTTSTHLKIIADLHAEEFIHFAADKVDFFGFKAKEHRQAQ